MERHVSIRRGSLEEVLAVHCQTPELRSPGTVVDYAEKIDNRFAIALIAESDGAPIGFKLGYALDKTTFYSWLGGVIPEHRGSGVAQALMIEQERQVERAGFSLIRVKSMNRYPGMLRLLLANDYQIDGYEGDGGPGEAKICFSKRLAPDHGKAPELA